MIQKYFGLCLKLSRRRLLLTQKEVSDYLKISRQAYCNYELGRCLPTPDTILDLSCFLGINLNNSFILYNDFGNDIHPIKSKKLSDDEIIHLANQFIEKSKLSENKKERR